MNPPLLSRYDLNKNKWADLSNKIIALANISWPEYKIEVRERGIALNKINDPRVGFFISGDTYRGRVEVSASFKKDNRYYSENDLRFDNKRGESSSCGFSLDREASAIISGIEKRFFPNFNKNTSHMVKLWDGEDNYQNAKDNAVKEICSAIDMESPLVYNSGNYRYQFSPEGENQNIKNYISDIYVSSGESIKITTSYLTKDQALKLIEVIKNL